MPGPLVPSPSLSISQFVVHSRPTVIYPSRCFLVLFHSIEFIRLISYLKTPESRSALTLLLRSISASLIRALVSRSSPVIFVRQTRFHLVARCPTLRGQARVLWKRAGRLCEWKEPRAPEVRLLFDDVQASPAVLIFLRDTRVGRIAPRALRGRRVGEDGREVDREGEEGRGVHFFLRLPFVLLFPSVRTFLGREGMSFLCVFLYLSLCWCILVRRRPYFGWQQSVVEDNRIFRKSPPPLPWPFGPHAAG